MKCQTLFRKNEENISLLSVDFAQGKLQVKTTKHLLILKLNSIQTKEEQLYNKHKRSKRAWIV